MERVKSSHLGQKVYKRRCLQRVQAAEKLVATSIRLRDDVGLEVTSLEQLFKGKSAATGEGSECPPSLQDVKVVCWGVPEEHKPTLQLDGLLTEFSEATDQNWEEVSRLQRAVVGANALVIYVEGEILDPVAKCLCAAAFLSGTPVLTYSSGSCSALQHACHLTRNTWPRFQNHLEVIEYLHADLPRITALRHALVVFSKSKVEDLVKVNKLEHFAKRAPLALVPFGVAVVNTMGLIRLAARVMVATGLLPDKQTNKVMGMLAGVAGVKAQALESFGDVYQFFVCGSILASVQGELFSEGVGAALDALEVSDLFLLGSAMGVGGVISTIAACMTRPQMFESMASLAATRQLYWLMNPALRGEATQPEGQEEEDVKVGVKEE